MWFFWYIVTTIVGMLLAPKPHDADASSLSESSIPTAEEGKSIALILGRAKVTGPNVTWWGDLSVEPIKKETGGFFGFFSQEVTVGYKYFVGMQMSLCCGPVDALEDILIDDKSLKTLGVASLPQAYSAAGTSIHVGAPELMGGIDLEGGVEGDVTFYFGSLSQSGDSYLAGQFGQPVPGYRGVCHAVLRHVYIGTQPYPKNWAWVLLSYPAPAGLNPTRANINGDANPAYGIAHILTLDPEQGGMGLSASRLDLGSFDSAGLTLYTEGLGISMQMDREQGADAWLGEICRTIDAVLYTDPASGLWTLKLIRADYDPDTLPEFGVGDVSAVESTTPTWPDTLNKVIVRYMDSSQGFSVRTVMDQDSANRAIRGEEASSTFDFMAISTAANAQKIAGRMKRTHAYPLASGQLTCNRKAWALRPGSPFKLTWVPMQIQGMCCRVTSIRYGAPEEGQITIDFLQDIFGIDSVSYDPPSASQWANPLAAPVPVAFQRMVEAPYGIVGETRNVMTLGVRGDTTTQNLDVYTNEGSGYLLTSTMSAPTPSGVLTAPWSAKTAAMDATGITIGSGKDLDHLLARNTNADGRNRGANIALIGNEWVSWTTATDNGNGTYTISGVLRGILDSVPEDHAIGDRVWFATEGAGLTRSSSSGGGTGPQGKPGTDGTNGRSYIWHGEWDSAHAYVVDDTCSRLGSSYVSIQSGTNQPPELSPAYWNLMAQKGADGTGGGGVLSQSKLVVSAGGTTTSLVTNDAPTIAQGISIGQITITPSAIGTRLVVKAKSIACLSAGYSANHCALFKDGASAAIKVIHTEQATATWDTESTIIYQMITTSLTPIIFEARAGSATAGTFTLRSSSFLEVQEFNS
jgi:hypothetical protein